jgi:hypothetical protein
MGKPVIPGIGSQNLFLPRYRDASLRPEIRHLTQKQSTTPTTNRVTLIAAFISKNA